MARGCTCSAQLALVQQVEGFDKSHAFFEKYGGVALIAGRFMPFVRTFAPFVAGVTLMTRRRFALFDISGAALWIGSVTLLGYAIGNLPWVKGRLQWIFLSMIIIPGVLALVGSCARRRRRRPPRHESRRTHLCWPRRPACWPRWHARAPWPEREIQGTRFRSGRSRAPCSCHPPRPVRWC